MGGSFFKPVVSTVWSTASLVTRTLSERGLLSAKKLDSYVVSVGNLQAGGTGKTPLIARIAREALKRGKSVCILSRGYRGDWEKSGGVVSAGQSRLDPRKVGDEVALLHDLVPDAWIAVGRDRIERFNEAVKTHGKPFDLTLLDDGFQHWKIKKDREILAVTSRTRGEVFFRDFENQGRSADLLVWTKGERRPAVLNQTRIPSVKIDYRLNVPESSGVYWLVSAIADPGFFREALENHGIKIKNELRFSDHDPFRAEQIERIEQDAARVGATIVMTGKDWVKWRVSSTAKNILVLEPELVFDNIEDEKVWERVLWG